jgi:DNA replication protein DnaC
MTNLHSEPLIGPCVACGKTLPFTAGELKNMDRAQSELEQQSPVVALALRKLPQQLLCPSCVLLTEKTRDEWIANQKQQKAAEYVQNNGLWLPEYVTDTFGNADPVQTLYSTAAWDTARDWCADSPNLWIYGHPGRGKTYMAHCLLNRELMRANTIAHLACYSLDTEARLFEWLKNKLRHYKGVDVLLLDDIDKPKETEAYRVLMDILEARNARKLRTVITFRSVLIRMFAGENQSFPNAFLERLNWRNVTCKRIELHGPSMRRNAEHQELIGVN